MDRYTLVVVALLAITHHHVLANDVAGTDKAAAVNDWFEFRFTAPDYPSQGKRSPNSTVYQEENVTLVVQCAFLCQQDETCTAYIFLKNSGLCQLTDEKIKNEHLVDDPEALFLKREAYFIDKV